ncbi:MAG: hypothetical protein R2822_05225 [Spirosomataceae bacterium]
MITYPNEIQRWPTFFDAHFHPTLKKHFANPEEEGALPMRNPWKTALRKDFLNGFKLISFPKCFIKPLVENSLVSQSSLTQLKDSNYKLSIVVLFAPDKGLLELIVRNKGFMKIVESGKFGNLLVHTQFIDLVNTKDAFATLKKDLELLKLADADGNVVVKINQRADFTPAPMTCHASCFLLKDCIVYGLICLKPTRVK